MQFLKSLVTNKKRLAVCLLIILVAGYFIYKRFNSAAAQTTYVLGTAGKQTIIASVSGTGQVSQDRTVNITSPVSAKLISVSVKQGQAVKAGQTIATVDQTNTTIALNQARASLASAQANLSQTLAGNTSQDIALAQLAVDAAQQSLDQAKTNLQTVTKQQAQLVANAYTNLMNSTLSAVPASGNIGNGTIAITGTYAAQDQGVYTLTALNTGVGNSGVGLQFGLSGLEAGTGSITKNSPSPLGTRGLYVQFTGSIYANDSWTITIPNTLASNYNANNNAYQTAQTNQTTTIASAQDQITSAQNSLKQAQINLQVKQQPPTDQQVQSANAQVTQAEASLQNAQIAYDNNILKAPFDGSVAALNNQPGDQVTGSTVIATVVTSQSIAVIPLNEVDVAKVAQGDKATMTFDAIDGLTITGKVAQIDNLGTVSQGVVSYNVKIAFDTEDPRVKPGMSVNVSIITNVAPDTLSVPNGAVQTQGGSSFVLGLEQAQTKAVAGQTGVLALTAPQRIPVQTGLSDDSNTQITGGGLAEGQSIVVQTITVSTAKTAASSATSALRLGGGGAVRIGGGAGGRAGN